MGAKAEIAGRIEEAMGNLTSPNFFNDLIASDATSLKTLAVGLTTSKTWTGIETIAKGLLVAYVIFYLVDGIVKDKHQGDQALLDICMLFFFGYAISHSAEIVTALLDLGVKVVNAICKGTAEIGTLVESIAINPAEDAAVEDNTLTAAVLEGYNLFQLIFDAVIYLIFGTLARWIVELIAMVAIYTVKIELCIRTCLFPLALASIPEGGMQGPGGRWIKHYFGCFMQYGIIMVAIKMYVVLQNIAAATPGRSMIVAVLAAGFACAGIMMKGSALANEVAGA